MGQDGCHALFTRALLQTRTEHPFFERIRLSPRSEPNIDGVADSINAHGDASVSDGLEAMLVALVELLDRLIGHDMAVKLIDRSRTAAGRGDTTSPRRREEA